jgi:uncharacterized membrane protein YsdA (DUF1294 family)
MEIANISILAAVYLIFNIAAFGAYGFDKAKAAMDKWRTPEKTLLILAVFGPFGAYAGMRVFRHKTQKKPFTWAVPLFLFIHVIFIGIILFLN